MGVVNWINDGGKDAATKIESSEDATMYVLGMSEKQLKDRWRGQLNIGDPENSAINQRNKKRTVYVKLFKQMSPVDTSVSIQIYDRQTREGNKLVHFHSSDDKGNHWMMSLEDLAEMNLAIAEAIQVYRQPDAWIALNKHNQVSGWAEDIKF